MNLKQFASTKKGQLTLCLSFLGIVWLILLISYGSSFLKDIPDQKKIDTATKELEKARAEFEKLNAEKKKHKAIEESYKKMAANAWLPGIDGPVETALRRKISKVSENQQFRLNSLSSVNPVRINEDFQYADISIQGAGEISDVIRFLGGISKLEPKLSWRQLQLTPDFRYNRQQGGGVQSINLAAQVNVLPATRLNFRGTLRVLVYNGKLTPEKLGVARLPFYDDAPETPETSGASAEVVR